MKLDYETPPKPPPRRRTELFVRVVSAIACCVTGAFVVEGVQEIINYRSGMIPATIVATMGTLVFGWIALGKELRRGQ